MKEIHGVACIVPFYNEKKYICNVMNVLSRVRGISQLIGVDDGSADGTASVIERDYPSVELINLKQNSGKAQAVKKGLEAVRYSYVLLVDADLRGLKAEDIQRAVDAVHRTADIDMIILRRLKAPWFIKFYRIDTLLSGERMIRTSDLKKIYEQEVKGYQLETAINVYMQKHGKKVYWSPSSAMNTFKMNKYRLMQGLMRDFRMYLSLISGAGIFNWIKLISRFGKERLPYMPGFRRRKPRVESEFAEE